MEKIVEQTLLFDFYGELLTSHQREVYEDVVLGDLGYSEAAQEYGVTRQGIHDLVKRVDRQLAGYEEKLHLVDRFLKIRKEVGRIRELAGTGDLTGTDAGTVAQICAQYPLMMPVFAYKTRHINEGQSMHLNRGLVTWDFIRLLYFSFVLNF